MKPEPNGNSKTLVCDGSCVEHVGKIRHVHVKHKQTDMDWGIFAYCEKAIEEDISRGLEVVEVEK